MFLSRFFLMLSCWLLCFGTAKAYCFEQAGRRYGLNPTLLEAIGQTESSLRPQATNLTHHARTGTYDIGLMQINSSWLPKLAAFGIAEHLREPCQNVMVGAWILANHMRESGFDWNGVGAYNASCRTLSAAQCRTVRADYTWKVYRNWTRAPAGPQAGAPPRRVVLPEVTLPAPAHASDPASNPITPLPRGAGIESIRAALALHASPVADDHDQADAP